jgi:hypothetical protein
MITVNVSIRPHHHGPELVAHEAPAAKSNPLLTEKHGARSEEPDEYVHENRQ